MASVKSVDESSVERKLNGAKNTQESIQSLCLWALHHKAQHDNIVKIWLNILKKSKIQRRLTLFYLCNEIVQTCKRKHAIMYKDAFKEVLRDAVILVRDNSVRNNIERIFSIWEERNIYDAEFIEDLTAILNNTKIRPSAAKLLAEYKPSKLRENIGKIVKLQKETEGKRRRMSSLNIDVTSQNYLKLLKDRSHGKQCTQQIEDLHRYLEEYVSNLEKEIKESQTQQELLEQSELFYDAQYGEAKIVTNAYKNFGTRVTNLRKKLEDIRKTLPDPLSPIPSPAVDAPSPVESAAEATEDNNETVDMEMSDVEDNDGSGEHRAYSPSHVASSSTPPLQSMSSTVDNLTSSPPKEMPGSSLSLPAAAKSSSDSLPDSPVATDSTMAAIDYNSTFLSRLPTDGLPSFSLQFNNSGSQAVGPSLDAGFTDDKSPSTAGDDEGGGTPVQDEKPEKAAKPAVDPVALLNQLLSCTKKSSDGTDFLKSLSVLTQSMNVPFKPPAEDEKAKKRPTEDNNGVATSLRSGSADEQRPQFQPFYHAKDYLSADVNSGSKEKSSTDTSCLSLPKTGSTESDVKTILPPPPLPPAFRFSSMGFRAMRPSEPPGDPGSSEVANALKTETNGKTTVNVGGEGILNMRPDLVEMLKNVLNTTKSTSSAKGQGVPDVLDPGPSAPTPPLQALNAPVVSSSSSSTGYEFGSSEVNGAYVESVSKRKSGFSSQSDPFASSQNFHNYMNTGGQQRVSSAFPAENKFQGPNWDEHNMQGHLEPPHFMQPKGDRMPVLYDGYDSQGLAAHSFPIQSQVRTPIEEGHPITPLLSARNLPEFTSPDMPHRGFGPDYANSDRNSGDGIQVYDIRPGLNRFPEPSFFDVRPRFPTEFSQGNPTRHFVGGPQLRLPHLRPPPRFLPRGFYPPY